MIREKQRTEINRRFAAYLKTGQVAPPDLATHVMLAPASGESPRLKPAAESLIEHPRSAAAGRLKRLVRHYLFL